MFEKFKKQTDVEIQKPVNKNRKKIIVLCVCVSLLSLIGLTFALYDTNHSFRNAKNSYTDINYSLLINKKGTDVWNETNYIGTDTTTPLTADTYTLRLTNNSKVGVKYELTYTCYFYNSITEQLEELISASDCVTNLGLSNASNVEYMGVLAEKDDVLVMNPGTSNATTYQDSSDIRIRINPVTTGEQQIVKVVFGFKFGYVFRDFEQLNQPMPSYGDITYTLKINGQIADSMGEGKYILTNPDTACDNGSVLTYREAYDESDPTVVLNRSLSFSSLTSLPGNCNLEFADKHNLIEYLITSLNDGTSFPSLEPYDIAEDASRTSQPYAISEYRFTGANPNNYVLFNNERWRIIGIIQTSEDDGNSEFKDIYNIKIIRDYDSTIDNVLTSDFIWNHNPIGASNPYYQNDWTASTLNQVLNTLYLGNPYSASNTTDPKEDIVYVGDYPYDFRTTYLSTRAQSMVQNATWYIAGFDMNNVPTTGMTGELLFNAERSGVVGSNIIGTSGSLNATSATYQSKIGLINGSDYVMASGPTCFNGNNTSGDPIDILGFSENYVAGEPEPQACSEINWINISDTNGLLSQWTINQSVDGSVISVDYGNIALYDPTDFGTTAKIRPVVYLDSELYYGLGTGTFQDPIKIVQ